MASPGLSYVAEPGVPSTVSALLEARAARGAIDFESTETKMVFNDAGRIERMAPMIPMARAGTADEGAESILFLLSDASSYTTGTMLRVAGGR